MIQTDALTKQLGGRTVVSDVTFRCEPGTVTGFLGPNGAGKTTTIEICEGLNTPDEGDVEVLGLSWKSHALELQERIGISLQETQLAEKITVEETVNLFRSFYRKARPLSEVIDAVQLGEKQKSRVGQLSGGQKQRLALALALVSDPELFFLDEPTTGLDPQSRRQLWELMATFRTSGRTVLITTHYMEEAEQLCDRVAIVDHGKVIAQGTPNELIATLGAQYVVEFGVADGASVSESELSSLGGVVAVRHEEGHWRLQVAELHMVVPALLALLDRKGAPLTELRTHAPTLEDVFVSLTGRHLRDV